MNDWWTGIHKSPHFKLPSNIYFDMDDTLTRTTHYFITETQNVLALNEQFDDLMEFNKLHSEGKTRFDYPEKFIAINKAIMRTGEYMTKSSPTPLFNYFFLIPGNQPRDTHFGIVTHRGDSKKNFTLTKNWFDQFDMAATLGKIHCIHPRKHPSKLEYLKAIHPDGDFLLVDDNPLYDTKVIHPHSPNLRIYDQYSSYGESYRNQHHVVYHNGMFLL